MKIIIAIANKILKIIKILKEINKYIDFKKLWEDFKENNQDELENKRRIHRRRNGRSAEKE